MHPLIETRLGIDLDSRVWWNKVLRNLMPFFDRDTRVDDSLLARQKASTGCRIALTSCFMSLQSHQPRSASRCCLDSPHRNHVINLLDTKPMQHIRHESLESHVLDTGDIFRTLEVHRSVVVTSLAGVVHQVLHDGRQVRCECDDDESGHTFVTSPRARPSFLK